MLVSLKKEKPTCNFKNVQLLKLIHKNKLTLQSHYKTLKNVESLLVLNQKNLNFQSLT